MPVTPRDPIKTNPTMGVQLWHPGWNLELRSCRPLSQSYEIPAVRASAFAKALALQFQGSCNQC